MRGVAAPFAPVTNGLLVSLRGPGKVRGLFAVSRVLPGFALLGSSYSGNL